MNRYTLFLHPQHADSKKVERLLHRTNFDVHLSDVTSNGISSYIFKDLGISELPALCIFSEHHYKVYEGFEKIQSFVTKQVK